MLKISIIENHHHVKSRTTQAGVVRYFQDGYIHNGGAFPEHIEIPLKNSSEAKQVGDYELDISNFQVGKFKNLQLNPFELKLTKIQTPIQQRKIAS